MAEPKCGDELSDNRGLHLKCDRRHGHAGQHRGYDEQHDAPLFWGNPANKGDGAPMMNVGDDMPMVEMPRYQCHKQVWALKIGNIVFTPSGDQGKRWTLEPADPGYAAFHVHSDWIHKHSPEIGGYYVVYRGGYASFSPAREFEDGYTRLL